LVSGVSATVFINGKTQLWLIPLVRTVTS
jgi:hypothetical protein